MRPLRSLLRVLALTLVAATPALGAAAPALAADRPYAPVDRPGPVLSVDPALLAAALECDADLSGPLRPVLLVPGTTLDPHTNFDWNYVRAFAAQGRPVCLVTLPEKALADVTVAAEYVVHALRTMSTARGGQVDVLGFSQGGMLPRWALRFWPDTRSLVGDVIGLAPSNHGTLDSQVLCRTSCPPAFWQQAATAAFVPALNSFAETFSGIDYTVVYTRTDQVVTPNADAASGSSSLRGGAGRVSNTAVQDVCPTSAPDHLALGSYDPVGYALVLDALGSDGPADPSRIDPGVCATLLHPGVDPATFATDYAAYAASIGPAVANGPQAPAEPPLPEYVFAASAPVAPVPVVEPLAPGPPAGGPVGLGEPLAVTREAPILPITGGGPVLAAVGVGLLGSAVALRRRLSVR